MNDRIDLKGIEVFAKHGVLDEEQERAQLFLIDVAAYVDTRVPAATDALSDAVDYGELAMEVREVVGSDSYRLIETVANKVADTVLSHEQVVRAVVTIHKPQAPIEVVFDDVSVTVDRQRPR